MNYCNKCKKIYLTDESKCVCGEDLQKNVALSPDTPVLLAKAVGFDKDRLLSALQDEGIPYEEKLERKSSGTIPVISGISTSVTYILVPYSCYNKALDILIGISPKDYPEDNAKIIKEDSENSEINSMSETKKIVVRIISAVLFLLVVWMVVTGTDFIMNILKMFFK